MTPTISVRLGISWASHRRGQRERLLQWLVHLGFGARIDLVVGEAAAYRIAPTLSKENKRDQYHVPNAYYSSQFTSGYEQWRSREGI